jgi:hypothetical protein
MRSVKTFFLGLAGVCVLAVAVSAQPVVQLSASDRELREYLPGDIVHILIEAPIDTTKIGAVMPDGSEIQLGFDARSSLWHGYWEIPPGFKKGLYRAKLFATDVAGFSFEGKTSTFRISEPILALMTRIGSVENGETAPPTYPRRAVVEAAPEVTQAVVPAVSRPARRDLVPEVKPEAKPVLKPVSQPVVEQEVEPEFEPEIIPKEEPAVKRPVKRVAQKVVRPKKMISVVTKGDAASDKAQLVAAVRSSMSRSEYEKARNQLKALLKTDPDNKEMKTILNRLEVVVRAKGTGK